MKSMEASPANRRTSAPAFTMLIAALLSIAGVLTWQLTMSSASHGAPEAVVSGPAHVLSAAMVGPAMEAVTTVSADESTSASSQQSMYDIACGLLGIGCMILLLAIAARLRVTSPSAGEALQLLVRRLRAVAQRLPRPPSIVVLSISRT